MKRPRLTATYRMQFHRDFPFAAAEALVPYLAELGISHLYASPIFAAVPGSQHGYDVTDPNRINPELGGEDGFERLDAALRDYGLGLILDIVPNHMAASPHNPYWMDVLEFGRAAPAARLFDIDWSAGRDHGKILLPVLGEPLQASIEAGAIMLRADYEAGRLLVVTYGENGYPLSPASAAALLAAAAREEPGIRDAATIWAELATGRLDPSMIAKARATLGVTLPSGREALARAIAAADLRTVLEAQYWRLAWWRTAADDLNYRRFFNITDLIGVRVEDPDVFAATHALVLDLVRAGKVDGLRVDHIDGLLDPARYLDDLRTAVGDEVPIFVEKILERGETLRDWPIEGTTGYERLADINGLFIDEAGWQAFDADLRARNLLSGTPAERIAAAKRDVLQASLTTEIDALAHLAREGLGEAMRAADLTETALRRGVVALLVHCPVYRSYATADRHAPEDEAVWSRIAQAVARSEDPLTAAAASVLLDRLSAPQSESDRQFRLRFQQVSGPAMAKGFEDTEFYRNVTLLSANEVGGDIEQPWREPDDIHACYAARAAAEACDPIPLATHDTKRGPETRARLNALSFVPERWLDFLAGAETLCAPLRASVNGRTAPDDTEFRLIQQTLFAAWPISPERMEAYLTKALREARRHSSWETPDLVHEEACTRFARALIGAPEAADYRAALLALLDEIERPARLVSLAQTILQLTLPGTPDIYQGTEFPDYSLVDPDNRRPVDWNERQAMLMAAPRTKDGEGAKFDIVHRLLQARRTTPALIIGDYVPLACDPSPWRWFGFRRSLRGDHVTVVVPTRMSAQAAPILHRWSGGGTDLLSGRRIAGDGALHLAADWPFLVQVSEGA
ncbi:MAG: malto-oligosyltrehalose synthase [Xanthobacteraceae bacterium]|jgi:(1->4)-alpha-D-glucan 1-alpha-D-glucosylmutase|nr:malto-oligosyltrehalose synthase [Xanthobacteraceae bacterium]